MAAQPTIAILAVQGAFNEHRVKLSNLGARCIELRNKRDLHQPFDGLILPGGESTVQGKLMAELGMIKQLRQLIEEGLPVLATCAGMILLAQHLVSGQQRNDGPYLATIPMTIRRNAYGRQLASFRTTSTLAGVDSTSIPMTFIRAPYVESCAADVRVLASLDGHPVAVRYKNQTALAFHPELDSSNAVHQAFLLKCKA